MKLMELEKATGSLARYARVARKEPLILTIHGKPVVALLFVGNVDWETLSLSTNPDFLEIIEESRKSLREEGGISEEEMRRRLGLKGKTRRSGR